MCGARHRWDDEGVGLKRLRASLAALAPAAKASLGAGLETVSGAESDEERDRHSNLGPPWHHHGTASLSAPPLIRAPRARLVLWQVAAAISEAPAAAAAGAGAGAGARQQTGAGLIMEAEAALEVAERKAAAAAEATGVQAAVVEASKTREVSSSPAPSSELTSTSSPAPSPELTSGRSLHRWLVAPAPLPGPPPHTHTQRNHR